MRCLITGGTGFVGSHVVELAIRKGWEVLCPVRDKNAVRFLKDMPVKLCSMDRLESELLESPDIDVVIHLAGATRALTYAEYYKANVEYTRWLIGLLISSGATRTLGRFVLVSSQAAAGPSRCNGEPVTERDTPSPVSSYGRSKLEGETITLSFKRRIPVTIVRPPTVFGPRDTDVFGVFRSARFRITPVVAGPDRLVSVIYVEDLAHGIVETAICDHLPSGEIFFLANEQPVIWREFARQIGNSLGYDPAVVPVPLPAMRLMGRFGDLLGFLTRKPALIRSEKIMEMEKIAWVCSASKARELLSWTTSTPLNMAIDKTRDWYVREGWI
jgi:nucleoside-diphosphate-sugar epimerase